MMQNFQMIGVGIRKVSRMKHFQLDNRRTLDSLWQLGGKSSGKKLLGFLALEGLDHGRVISRRDIIVTGYYVELTTNYS